MSRRRKRAPRRTPAAHLLAVGAARADSALPHRRYIDLAMRQLTIADMVPGSTYEPGMTILRVIMHPTTTAPGLYFDFPIWVPEEFRKPTAENAALLYSALYEGDPNARSIIDCMKLYAKPWSEVVPAAKAGLQVIGKILALPNSFPIDDAEKTAAPHAMHNNARQ